MAGDQDLEARLADMEARMAHRLSQLVQLHEDQVSSSCPARSKGCNHLGLLASPLGLHGDSVRQLHVSCSHKLVLHEAR